ncbi:carbon-nitrogen hydrolase family protein [Alteromonas sp. ASW11-130]|uniref:carbon-nitrogen hydrolase family protein n=1 Tax=Alteromonas sp. ASW11-130 TaxID=3015775 RepID=UPI002242C32C|nr:carbon-nitrogen hydrolase family protein [Alteromonas sp. ASW11-130]MCW8091035.1 carbon-nitrogen hydrolase family protein [Alteromonas sp. ASW11-130]
MVNLCAVQMTSNPDMDANFAWIDKQLSAASGIKNALVVLPECFAFFGDSDKAMLDKAEPLGEGPIQQRIADLAQKYQCYIVGGTIPIKTESPDKFAASSLLFSPNGNRLADYQKIHLFDVAVVDNTGSYQESKHTLAGNQIVTVDTEIGRIGMAVCYDVRFPGLFSAMGDIDILVLPAAFTRATGKAHWHTLLRARAIEKQCFVVGANQCGTHANNRKTYGHSLVYSPWGDVLVERPDDPGLAIAECDLRERDTLKQRMPLTEHNRFRSYIVE